MAIPMGVRSEKTTATSSIQNILDDAVQRILSVVKSRRIILFGSAARGNMGPDSDLDILNVKSTFYISLKGCIGRDTG